MLRWDIRLKLPAVPQERMREKGAPTEMNMSINVMGRPIGVKITVML